MLGVPLIIAAVLTGSGAAAATVGNASPLGPAREWRLAAPAGMGKESRPIGVPTAKAGGVTIVPTRTEEAVTDPRIEVIAPGHMDVIGGSAYHAALERGQGVPSDAEGGSECILRENGVALGPAHATHEQIQSTGGGAYSHSGFATLYFSSSDNSSPITNGRTYSLDCTRRIVVSRSRVATAAPSASFELSSPAATVWNRRTTIRNLDPVVAVRAQIRERGTPDLSSTQGIIASIIAPGMTPESRSIAIWQLLTNMAYNWHPAQADAQIHDPVKFMNVYGYGYCDDYAESFAVLAEAAGIPSRVHFLNGHVVAESFYDGQWHMFDPDFGLVLRGADGDVLSVDELAADPTPILNSAHIVGSQNASFLADVYATTHDNEAVSPSASTLHRIEPVLQPGDEVTFDSGPAPIVRNALRTEEPNPPLAGMGTLTRTLAFPGAPTEVVVPFEWPYVLVGGSFTGDGDVAISANGIDWTSTRDFASWFAGRSQESYGFHLRVRNPGPGAVLSVAFQFAPLSLPAVRPGVTTFDLDIVPVSGSFGADWRGVEIVQEWEDRTAPGNYAIAANVAPLAGGSANCAPDPVAVGGTVSCTATPNPGYAFTGWSGDCTGATCTLANVDGVRSVTAMFEADEFTIATSASPADGGVVACTPNPVDSGGTSTCTATANAGRTFTAWAGDCTGATCTLMNVTGPRSVVAQFSVNTYAIAVAADPVAGGAASCSPNPVAHGGTATCTASASAGYAFAGWDGDCTGLACTLTSVTSARSVTARFVVSTHAITVGVDPAAGGTASCIPNPVAHGGTALCTVNANVGYTFAGWDGDCTGLACTLANVTSARSVTARFIVATHAVTVGVDPAGGGTASCIPNPVAHGGTANCTATANAGRTFTGWAGDCTGATCTLANVTAPKSVVAQFSVNTYAIAVTANPVSGGTASCSPNPVAHGGTATCTANASAGYTFVGWDGDCTGTSCNLNGITAARSVTARFTLELIVITTAANPASGGSVSCDPNPAPAGNLVTCTATPAAGYSFTGWSGASCGGTGPCSFSATQPMTVTANFAPPSSATPRLVNASTRVQVLPGDGALIAGFIIGGTGNKAVVIRARGPSLAAAGIANVLANPALQLFSAQTPIAYNDDWQQAPNAASLQASGLAPGHSQEAAILIVLAPGAYTAVMTAGDSGRGIGIIEVFEADRPESPLVNLSSRGAIQSGDNVMIGGFIIQGDSPQTVVVRARGPSLASFGIIGALADPVLELHSGQGRIATNDNWGSAANALAIQESGYAPVDGRESAILITLDPGAYTAIVRGAPGSTGIGIVEVFAR